MKLNLILGGLLLTSIAGSAWYIDRLLDQIAVLKGNQVILETEIQKQNDSINQMLAKAKENQAKMDSLNKASQEAQREVNKLRQTFAKHDLDALALAKPALIQRRVNNGTKKVKEELIQITDPNQFDKDEKDISN